MDNKSGEDRAKPGVPGLIGRVVGGAGVAGAAYYQPMVLGGVGVLVLLLVVGVVFPGVWSRNAERRDAADAMSRAAWRRAVLRNVVVPVVLIGMVAVLYVILTTLVW